jgi:DNA polymerase III delta prime subunit
LLIKYKPAQKKDPEEDYGFSMSSSDQDSESNNAYISGKQYFQQTDSTKAMLKFNKLVTKINKRYKLQNVLTTDKVNALNTLNKVISEYIENINSIIVDASSNSSLIQMIGENAKQIVEQANALIQVKSPDNDDLNPTVEDII